MTVRHFYTEEKLVELAASDSFSDRFTAARVPGTSEETLLQLACHDDSNSRFAVAERKNLPITVLKILAEDVELDIRTKVVKADHLPVHIQRMLAKDKDWVARKELAKRVDLDDEVTRILANDEYSGVRDTLAQNRTLPALAYQILAADGEYSTPKIHNALSANPSIPGDIFEQIFHNWDSYSRNFAAGNPSFPPNLIRKFFGEGLFSSSGVMVLVYNPACPVDVLEAIVKTTEDKSVSLAAIERLIEEEPQYAGMPAEWVRAVMVGDKQ